MRKVAVVYWSGTGNTQEMAELVAGGARDTGAEVTLHTAPEFNPEVADNYDAIGFGCPAMGAEVLEENDFQPMWDSVLPKLRGKKIALFGSYGWGDGEWMRNWEKECAGAGALFACDFVVCCETPDAAAKPACTALGKALAG